MQIFLNGLEASQKKKQAHDGNEQRVSQLPIFGHQSKGASRTSLPLPIFVSQRSCIEVRFQ